MLFGRLFFFAKYFEAAGKLKPALINSFRSFFISKLSDFELFLALLAFRLDMIFFSNSDTGSSSLFVFFFTCIPGIAVSVRRLHDISKSGWWLLISLTGIGNFLLLYWFLLPSESSDNIYN